jgi:4-diphosphocytidyl-2-C-methyl-D-erythritol kinase
MADFSFTSEAKINLGLSILGRAMGGYHEVETIMHKIPLKDSILVKWRLRGQANQLICPHSHVPQDQTNLLLRAFALLQVEFNLPPVQITLHKNIPVGAGLSGGSFNAGCFLAKINQELKLDLSPSRLLALALKLGADVPFALNPAACMLEQHHGLVTLRQTVLPKLPPCKIALIFQDIFLSTKELYQQIDQLTFTPSRQQKLCQALQARSLPAIATQLNNDFSHLVFARYPQLVALKAQLRELGALGVGLSGKGPTLFALFPPEATASSPLAAAVVNIKESL